MLDSGLFLIETHAQRPIKTRSLMLMQPLLCPIFQIFCLHTAMKSIQLLSFGSLFRTYARTHDIINKRLGIEYKSLMEMCEHAFSVCHEVGWSRKKETSMLFDTPMIDWLKYTFDISRCSLLSTRWMIFNQFIQFDDIN